MLKLPKPTVVLMRVILGAAVGAPWAVAARADAEPANTATQTQTTPPFHEGEVVRLRSGGPPMTVKSIEGDWLICTWWNDGYGEFETAGFPIAALAGPITASPDPAQIHEQSR
jgi:uncharacterized protein YodC (DUF2158 family)